MSRLEFRAAVDAPRPAAAWVMVAVGGSTLWITRQLDPWAIAVQALGIVVSLLLRTRPHPWQRSPIALNVGMLGVVATTVAVALRGQPSTIALAHFAALTQALQLLDARPRRSEFLLVVLALFQVILAANLTDSVFFVPLLAVFVVSTTWTLMVHTLRTEAIEAGMPRAVTRALTPGLLRSTLLASGASLLLALGIFLILPRMHTSMIRAPGLGSRFASAGFSDQVQLGDLGRIRRDPTVVMRIETLRGRAPEPRQAYWRGLAFDHFDGRNWAVTPASKKLVAGSPEVGLSLTPDEPRAELEQRIVREAVASGVVFVAGSPEKLRATARRVHRDANGSLYALGTANERLRYTVESRVLRAGERALAGDRIALPPRDGARYLQLPELSPKLGELARRITAATRTDAARVRAIEGWLLRNGRYDDRPPRLDPADPRSPVEVFLLGGATGHCEYFASSMVVLARSLSIPARLVNGFAGGRENAIGGFVEVTRSDAHSWVEVHFADAGWIRYDPTPPDLRLRAATALSLADRLAELSSAIELWWFQRVVDFDRSDQFLALRSAWQTWRTAKEWTLGERGSEREPLADWHYDRGLVLRAVLVAPALTVLGVLGLRAVRRRRRGGDPPPRAYRQALVLLARRGLERPPACTARDFAAGAAARLPEEAASAFRVLTEAYLAERFGARHDQGTEQALHRLRAALEGPRG